MEWPYITTRKKQLFHIIWGISFKSWDYITIFLLWKVKIYNPFKNIICQFQGFCEWENKQNNTKMRLWLALIPRYLHRKSPKQSYVEIESDYLLK